MTLQLKGAVLLQLPPRAFHQRSKSDQSVQGATSVWPSLLAAQCLGTAFTRHPWAGG